MSEATEPTAIEDGNYVEDEKITRWWEKVKIVGDNRALHVNWIVYGTFFNDSTCEICGRRLDICSMFALTIAEPHTSNSTTTIFVDLLRDDGHSKQRNDNNKKCFRKHKMKISSWNKDLCVSFYIYVYMRNICNRNVNNSDCCRKPTNAAFDFPSTFTLFNSFFFCFVFTSRKHFKFYFDFWLIWFFIAKRKINQMVLKRQTRVTIR
jgi:hypothetical protein